MPLTPATCLAVYSDADAACHGPKFRAIKATMRSGRSKRFVSIFAASILFGVLALAACSNAGEGDRCELLNGSEDCQSGLVCTQVGTQSQSVCCPPDRRTATALACTQNVTPVTGDAAPPADTGPEEDASEPDVSEEDAAPSDAATADATTSTPDSGVSPDAEADAAP